MTQMIHNAMVVQGFYNGHSNTHQSPNIHAHTSDAPDLAPVNPAHFEVVWNSASTIYKSLGTISKTVRSDQVKAHQVLAAMSEAYKDVRDLSQPTFKPSALMNMSAEAGAGQILTKAVLVAFEPNKSTLNPEYDSTIPATLEEIGKLAGKFGNAYIIIEGNTDASKRGIVPVDLVRKLSYDRADAVRRAIMDKYQFDPNKFKVVGNGCNPKAHFRRDIFRACLKTVRETSGWAPWAMDFIA